MLKRLKEDYGIHRIIISADRGLNSKKNLARSVIPGYDYVMAYKILSASKAIKSLVLDTEGYYPLNADTRIKVTEIQQQVKLDEGAGYRTLMIPSC